MVNPAFHCFKSPKNRVLEGFRSQTASSPDTLSLETTIFRGFNQPCWSSELGFVGREKLEIRVGRNCCFLFRHLGCFSILPNILVDDDVVDVSSPHLREGWSGVGLRKGFSIEVWSRGVQISRPRWAN